MNNEISSSVQNSETYPHLEEYPLQFNFLQLIPKGAQKGLNTFDLELTCIDADGHYFVLGSNFGIVYLYDRKKHILTRLRNEHKDVITVVKVLISIECLVLCGSKKGYVSLFKVPFDENDQIEKFSVNDLHFSSVTSLEWDNSGLKFFSGDENGVVVCTEVDYFEHQSKSRILLNEQSKIVQLSYSKSSLVISTSFRSLIYSIDENTCSKIGQKERKCFGPFGAIITRLNDSSEDIIFASRPGQRLWKSDKHGIIQETMIFKNIISEPHPTILLKNQDTNLWTLSDFQFSLLKTYLDKYVLIYSDTSFLLIDPEQKSIMSSCPKLDPIVDLCTANDEIFVLRGLRNLVRISSYPDPYICNKVPVEPSLMEELLVPFKELGTFVKEKSDSFSIPTENTNIFDWLRKRRSASTPSVFNEDDSTLKSVSVDSELLPQVVQLKSDDIMPIVVDKEAEVTLIPAIKITSTDETDDIVYKRAKKKKNKKVRFRSKSPKSDRKSSELSNEGNIKENTKEKEASLESVDLNSNKQVDETATNLSDETSQITNDSNSLNLISQHENLLNDSTDSSSANLLDDNLNNIQNQTEIQSNSNQNDSGDILNNFISSDLPANEDVVDHMQSETEELQRNEPDDIYLSFDSKLVDSSKETPPVVKKQESVSSEETSIASKDSFEPELPKYGVEWVEYKAPEMLLDLSISDYHIYCVDAKNTLYISHYPILGMHWVELSQPAERVAVSPADTIIWVLYKGTVYTAIQKSTTKWKDAEWVSIARDVISIAVENDCGWYVTASGLLYKQPNLTASKPYSYPEDIKASFTMVQIACQDRILWSLSTGGKLYCWNTNNEQKKSKSQWEEIEFENDVEIDSISLGIHQTGWVIDCNGVIRFILGVTLESPKGLGKSWEVETSKYMLSNTSQFQKTIKKALNNDAFSSIIKGKQHISFCTSSQGVWFCKTFDNLVYCNAKSVIGHSWNPIIPLGTSSTMKWSILAASGLTPTEESLWCVDATGELFCFSLATNTLIAVDAPSIKGIRCLVPSMQSLWLLSEDGAIYVRRGITPNCLQGVWWQNLDLKQLGSEVLTFVSCSPEATWACSSEGQVFMRLGTLCPSSDRKLTQAWIPINSEVEMTASAIVDTLSAIGKKFPLPLVNQNTSELFFCKIYIGPLGYPVWALDNKRTVYVREGVSNHFPIGTKWTCVPELKAKDLCISKNAVWLLKNSGKIYRRFGVSEKNPCGDYWKQIPGLMSTLSVSQDDDLWGIKDDLMLRHSSYVLNCTPKDNSKKLPARAISEEDDWEDIMADTSDDEI